ncbi:type I secretion system permease/ATPase [Roseovarius gahaiensis]|uniref:hypothetical protein n=1 Tax=Roseovarius gahaiensis TaxID=2716691 RepID=UPI001E2F23C9|nr:hypothetical protein [Roseovarius gahaiensis]
MNRPTKNLKPDDKAATHESTHSKALDRKPPKPIRLEPEARVDIDVPAKTRRPDRKSKDTPTDAKATETSGGGTGGTTDGGGGGGGSGGFHKRLGPVDFSGNLKAGLASVRRNIWVVMLFTLATNLLILAIPVYLFQISDRVLTSRSTDTLIMLTVVIVGAVILQAFFDAIRRFILMRTAVEVAARLGSSILSAAARASLHGTGREYQTLGDLQQLRGFLVSGTLLSILDVPFAPIFILAIFLVHPHLGLIVIGTALALLVIALINQRLTARHFG